MDNLVIARSFSDACDYGKGWLECKKYCHDGATFETEAETLAGVDRMDTYCDWMVDALAMFDENVEIDERLFRPHEVPLLLGDPSKAKEKLGWEPKTKFVDLAQMMHASDFRVATYELQKTGRSLEPEAWIPGQKMKFNKA